MAHQDDSISLLKQKGLNPTPHRVMVLGILGNSPSPLSPQEIFATLQRFHPMNRVTLYRILEVLVAHGLVERIQSGDKAYRYGLNAQSPHAEHPHFYCSHCGGIQCVHAEGIHVQVEDIQKTFPGLIQKMEIRLDGICKNCLRNHKQKKTGNA